MTNDRGLLGVADLPDDELTTMIARQLGVAAPDEIELVDSSVDVAVYDLEALTTAGRYWVRGHARTSAGVRPFSFFVKVVQSWARSPTFARVPPELREQALEQLPWRTEPLVYRSDVASRLPAGLSVPTAFAIVDLDEDSAAIWLGEVDLDPHPWNQDRFVHAARLLGRLAGSPRVRPLARIGKRAKGLVRGYAEGRLAHQVLPWLRTDELWSHPLVAEAFDPQLRARLLGAAGALESFVEEIETVPIGTCHGDACTRNLLVQRSSPDLVLIDFGFWSEGPVGFDLGQLLLGEVQLGERPASCLPGLETSCLPAYVDGLRAEGCDADLSVVRRAHALLMLLFSGLSAVPFEHLGAPPTPALRDLSAQRADSARFILDLVDAT